MLNICSLPIGLSELPTEGRAFHYRPDAATLGKVRTAWQVLNVALAQYECRVAGEPNDPAFSPVVAEENGKLTKIAAQYSELIHQCAHGEKSEIELAGGRALFRYVADDKMRYDLICCFDRMREISGIRHTPNFGTGAYPFLRASYAFLGELLAWYAPVVPADPRADEAAVREALLLWLDLSDGPEPLLPPPPPQPVQACL